DGRRPTAYNPALGKTVGTDRHCGSAATALEDSYGNVRMSEVQSPPALDLPESLWRDRSFWGMTATQFLGAFNDNLFKQVVLLLCSDIAVQHGTRDYQPQAQRLFALPFVLFSGFAGYLSDRFSKRGIAIICKACEIAIVALGTWSLSLGSLPAVFVVLFCM